jgi:hypothetical protein
LCHRVVDGEFAVYSCGCCQSGEIVEDGVMI